MKTIKAYDGRICRLSDERYVILDNEHPSHDTKYGKGDIVHLISSEKNESLGQHFSTGYRTVCSENAAQAEFCGIKRTALAELA